METNFNLGSLKIIQVPLMDYLKQATINLEENLKLIQEEKKIPTNYESIDVLVKTQKTLNMIGLNGLAKVLAVAEESLKAVKDVQFDSKKNLEIIETVIHVLTNASLYIQRLVNSGIDQPTKFFTDYNKLATLLNKEVYIKDLFFPKLDLIDTVDEQIQNDLRSGIFINESSKRNIILHLDKVHSSLQSKFLDVFKVINVFGEFEGEDDKQSYQAICKQLYESFDYSQKLKINKNFYILFGIYKLYVCVLSPVFNGQFKQYVQGRQSFIKNNLGKSERVIARLIQNIKEMEPGEKTGGIKIDDEIVKEIVYEVIFAINQNGDLKNMPVYKDLEKIFDIEYYEDELNNTKSLDVDFYSAEKIQEIETYFLDIKEEFNILNSKVVNSPEFFNQLIKNINISKKIMDNLVHSKEVKQLFAQLGLAFNGLKNKTVNFNEELQKEISLALVLADYGINGFVKNSVDERLKKDYASQVLLQVARLNAVMTNNLESLNALSLPRLDTLSQKADEKKTLSKIFEQLSNDLTKIEETLDYFLRNEGENIDEVSNIYKPLVGMKGIFAIIGKEDLSKVVVKISDAWKKVIDQKDQDDKSVDLEELNESISFVGGLSLMVKAFVSENENEAEELYNNLMKMFYQKNKDEIETKSTVPEFGSSLEEEVVTTQVTIEETPVEDVPSFTFSDPVVEPIVEETPTEIKDTVEMPVVEITINQNIPSAVEYRESTNDPDIAEVYLMEAEEVLENLKTSFTILSDNIDNKEELTNVRRYFHTLKGSGRMVGLEFMGEAAWMAEQTLNKCLGGELPLTEGFFAAIKDVKEKFEVWVQQLKDTNEVVVDLINVKKLFLELNPSLTNHIQIVIPTETFGDPVVEPMTEETTIEEVPAFTFGDPVFEPMTEETTIEEVPAFTFGDPMVEPITEETTIEEVPAFTLNTLPMHKDVKDDVEEDNNETLMIEGHPVSKILYDLFNEESATHIERLKEQIHSEYNEPILLDEEFMRHAHTLASISASVNLSRIAKIAAKIENIAVVTIERNLALSQLQMNAVRHAVDNIDLFKNFNSSDHTSYYDSLMKNLTSLYTELYHDETEEEDGVDAEVKPVSVETSYVEKSFTNGVDVEKLKEQLTLEITEKVMEQNKKLIEILVANNNETVAKLTSDIEEFKQQIAELKVAQEQKEQLLNKSIEVIKKDITVIANVLKKKIDGSESAIARFFKSLTGSKK